MTVQYIQNKVNTKQHKLCNTRVINDPRAKANIQIKETGLNNVQEAYFKNLWVQYLVNGASHSYCSRNCKRLQCNVCPSYDPQLAMIISVDLLSQSSCIVNVLCTKLGCTYLLCFQYLGLVSQGYILQATDNTDTNISILNRQILIRYQYFGNKHFAYLPLPTGHHSYVLFHLVRYNMWTKIPKYSNSGYTIFMKYSIRQ